MYIYLYILHLLRKQLTFHKSGHKHQHQYTIFKHNPKHKAQQINTNALRPFPFQQQFPAKVTKQLSSKFSELFVVGVPTNRTSIEIGVQKSKFHFRRQHKNECIAIANAKYNNENVSNSNSNNNADHNLIKVLVYEQWKSSKEQKTVSQKS